MKPHKWAKEIKAWADGEEIEYKVKETGAKWYLDEDPKWNDFGIEYRIKPQEQQSSCCCKQTCSAPKEPQYLYVLLAKHNGKFELSQVPIECHPQNAFVYIGKIKLEQDE